MIAKPFLSVIIPAYNEEKRLGESLNSIKIFLSKKPFTSEIIVVDDGSIDQTLNIVKNSKEEKIFENINHHRLTPDGILNCSRFYARNIKIIALRNNQNLGKGASIRHGVSQAAGELILFTDADNSTPIAELDRLIPKLTLFDLVIGSRHLKESSILIHQPWYRKVMGRMANLLIQLLLLPGISDTQCGFKLFKGEVAHDLFQRTFLARWGFDMEILYLAKKKGYKIGEIPVTWVNSSASRLRPIKDGLRTLRELLQIKLYDLQGRYSR